MTRTPARKRGYAGRYLKHELRQNWLSLVLGAVFLLGAAAGCRAAQGGVLERLSSCLSGTGREAGFLSGVITDFAANAAVLCVLFLSGFGAVFQPLVLAVLFLKGLGFGVMGVYSYRNGEQSAVLYYLLVLLPEALAALFLLTAAARESLRFSKRFWVQLLPMSTQETQPLRQRTVRGYLAHFVLFYLLSGSAALLSGVLKLLFEAMNR